MKKQDSDMLNKDVFGKAISAFYNENDDTDIIVHSPDFDDDIIPVPYLFREFKEMPELEKKALKLAKGKVLDVGSGAGSHSLYLQNERALEVNAIDISTGAVDISIKRGVKNARNIDYFQLKDEQYDTVLLLMNGTGIIEKMNQLDKFFQHTKTLLAPDGQVLIDSSDLSYLLDPDEDGGIWVDMDGPYYGELEFNISYKGERSDTFNWLYLDYNSLELAAAKNGFSCKLIAEGEHYDYLAQLKIN